MDRLKKIISVILIAALIASAGASFALADGEASEEAAGEVGSAAEPEAAIEPETVSEPEAAIEPETVPEPEEAEPAEAGTEDEPAGEEPAEELSEDDPEEPEEDAASSDEPEEEEEDEERAWVEPGNTDAEITGGGRYLITGGVLYYSDGGIWADVSGGTRFLSGDDGVNLNLSDGWLYYTVSSGDVRRVPASGGSVETVYSFGSYIRQLYVMGSELRFLSGGSVYSYDMETQELETLVSPSNVMSLIPTPLGNVFLTGDVFSYTVWAGSEKLCTGVAECHRDGNWLVIVKDGQTLQESLTDAFDGVYSPAAYSLHSEMLVSNGLSEEEQLANEAAFLQSSVYEAMQEELSVLMDGAYVSTNSNIASTAYASSSLTNNQKNIVLRARQFAEVKWTPLYKRYSWGGDDSSYVSNNMGWGSKVTATDGTTTYGYFVAGKTYQGIPYSQAVYTGYVGYSISIDGFVQAVNNSSSKFYSGYSYYSRTAPYYGSDCASFVAWAWNLSNRCTCTSLLNYSTYIGKSLSSLKIGDCLNNPNSHVVLITNIGYDSSGNVNAVEITEMTPCKMRVTCYGELFPGKTYEYTGTLSYLERYYFNGGYSIYRRAVSSSVTFTESAAVNLEESGYAAAPSITVTVNDEGNGKVVTLSHSNSKASIYYTTDGTKPTSSSKLYTGSFTVSKETTIRAIAVLGAPYTGSYELTYTVSVTKAESPFIVLIDGDMQDGYVSSGSTVTAINNDGDTIYYTTDGTTPTKLSSVMPAGGIKVTKDMTLKAIAVSGSNLNSNPATITVKVGTFYKITATAMNEGGYISPGGETGVLKGSNYTFNIVALDHYVIEDVKVDNKSLGAITSYTFTNVSAKHTISVTYAVSMPFTDVTTGWYVDEVAFAYSHDLFAGTTTTKFSPNTKMTRGMFITVLGRFAGNGQWDDLESWSGTLGVTNATAINIREITNTSDTSVILGRTGAIGQHVQVLSVVPTGLDGATWYRIKASSATGYVRGTMNDSTNKTLLYVYSGGFTDLPDGVYYTGYAQWAYTYGLMSGVSSTSFAPNSYILRQDICVLFYEYLTKYLGRTLTIQASTFTDDASISSYARTAVYAMKSIGVVTGYTDGSFNPRGYASRAEVATMFETLYRYLNS